MEHLGPDLSEALPVGEETLSLEQLGRVADYVAESRRLLDEKNANSLLTTEEREAVSRLQAQRGGSLELDLFKFAKDALLHPPVEIDE